MPGGGVGNAIVGTLVMVFIAGVISVPFGMLAGVFLGLVAPDSVNRRRKVGHDRRPKLVHASG